MSEAGKTGGRGSGGLKFALVALAALAAAGGFFFALGPAASPSPGEAMTLQISRQYFTVTLVIVFLEKLFPLYYAAAHFVLMLPGGLYILRVVSFVSFLLMLYGIKMIAAAPAKNEKARRAGVYVYPALGLIPFLTVYAWRAEPVAPAACLIVYSMLYFLRGYILGEESARGRHVAVTTLALYATPVALPFFLIQAIITRRMKSGGGGGRILRLIAPMIVFWAAGAARGLYEGWYYSSDFADVGDCLVLAGALPAAGDAAMRLLPVACQVFFAVFVAALLLFSARGRSPGRAAAWLTFIMGIPVFVSGAWFYMEESGRARTWADTALYVESVAAENAGVVFLESQPDRTDYYLFDELKNRTGARGIILPRRNFAGSAAPRRVTSAFRDDPGARFSFVAAVKELFLMSDGIIVVESGVSTGTCNSHVRHWLSATHNVENKQEFGQDISIFRMKQKEDIYKDGVLLDLLLNDYGDKKQAYSLIREKDFNARLMGGYYTEADQDGMTAKRKRFWDLCKFASTCPPHYVEPE